MWITHPKNITTGEVVDNLEQHRRQELNLDQFRKRVNGRQNLFRTKASNYGP
ncbi:hypothetical protein ACFQZB_06060 [Arthrobacter ulcerisalmonis]